MMFLTLALSVMAMGSAMANDSAMDKNYKPNKVKIEINHNCCGDHDHHYFEVSKSHRFHKHFKHSKRHDRYHKGPYLGCPVCTPKPFDKGGRKPGHSYDGKRPGGHYGEPGGFNGRPGGRR